MNRKIIKKFQKSKRGYWYMLQCLNCDIHFEIQGYKFNEGKGQYCSQNCANQSILHLKNVKKAQKKLNKWGVNNPNWKGGKSPFYLYQKHRKKFCNICGIKEMLSKRKTLSVHHIDGNRSNNQQDNLTTLCEKCHHKIHNWNRLNRKRSKKGRYL